MDYPIQQFRLAKYGFINKNIITPYLSQVTNITLYIRQWRGINCSSTLWKSLTTGETDAILFYETKFYCVKQRSN